MKWKKKMILAKMEPIYGQDSAPTGAANSILARDIKLSPLVAGTVQRDNPRPELGGYQEIHVGEHVMLDFDVEIAGAGSLGGIPNYGPLMRACGLAQTNNVGASTVYDPVSENEESATIYVPFDGQLHPMVGARGAWSFRYNKSQIPYWHYMMKGLWVDPSSVPDPVPDRSGFQEPLYVSKQNTPTFSIHGNDLIMSKLELNSNNEVVHRDWVNLEEIAILDRSISGKVVFEAPDLDVWNAFITAKNNVVDVLQLVHGTVAGNIVQTDGPKAQILNPTYGEAESKVTIEADLKLIPDAGDDEIKFTIR